MKTKKNRIILVLSALLCFGFNPYSIDVFAETKQVPIKSTGMPFEDKEYDDVTDEDDKAHNIQSKDAANERIDTFKEKANFGIDVEGVDMAKTATEKFINIAAGLILGFAVIMIAFAGFKIASSEGDSRTVQKAKMQIITAGIGIGLSLFVLVIVKMFVEILSVYH